MLPKLIQEEAQRLTEETSLKLFQLIESEKITMSLISDSISTTYVKQGEGGFPILLLHGFDSSLLEFRRLLPWLACQNETWAIDLLGFGFTERKSNLEVNPLNIKTHLYYFWKNLIQKPLILVGASMGGATALDFTLSYPQCVEKLVLIDSAGLAKPPIAGKFMFPPFDYLLTEFLRNKNVRQSISKASYYNKKFANLDANNCASLHLNCTNWSQGLISFTKSGGYGNFKDKLSFIEQKTLILWGKQDKILGIKDAEKFKQLIPHSELIWVENCGHVPHLEQAQITASNILRFSKEKFFKSDLPVGYET
jgi:pimeloyl-ACP methyl ester carboxylesterase